MTTQSLGEMFKKHQEQMDKLITERLKAIQTAPAPTETTTPAPIAYDDRFELEPGMDDSEEEENPTRRTPIVYRVYTYGNRFRHTPKTFVLPPRMKLNTGWKMWCSGIPCYQITDNETGKAAPIRPFRHFKNKMLPKEDVRQHFFLHWRTIFEITEACPGLDPANADSFERGIEILKNRVKYVFQKRRAKPMQ